MFNIYLDYGCQIKANQHGYRSTNPPLTELYNSRQ